jgi:hypothetical protein
MEHRDEWVSYCPHVNEDGSQTCRCAPDLLEVVQENERLRSGLLSEDDAEAIALTVVARSRATMRVTIGDRTPRQYDRADQMAGGIKRAVYLALAEIGVYEPEEDHASTG